MGIFKAKHADRFKYALNTFHMKMLKTQGQLSVKDYMNLLRSYEKLGWGNEESHTTKEIVDLIQEMLANIPYQR